MCNFTMLNYVFEVHCHSAFRFHFTVTSHITHYAYISEFESWLATFTYSQLFLDIAFTVQVEVIFIMCKLYLLYLRLT